MFTTTIPFHHHFKMNSTSIYRNGDDLLLERESLRLTLRDAYRQDDDARVLFIIRRLTVIAYNLLYLNS